MGDYVYKYNVILCKYNVIWVQSMDVLITLNHVIYVLLIT